MVVIARRPKNVLPVSGVRFVCHLHLFALGLPLEPRFRPRYLSEGVVLICTIEEDFCNEIGHRRIKRRFEAGRTWSASTDCGRVQTVFFTTSIDGMRLAC